MRRKRRVASFDSAIIVDAGEDATSLSVITNMGRGKISKK